MFRQPDRKSSPESSELWIVSICHKSLVIFLIGRRSPDVIGHLSVSVKLWRRWLWRLQKVIGVFPSVFVSQFVYCLSVLLLFVNKSFVKCRKLLVTVQWCLFWVSKPAFQSDSLKVVCTVGNTFSRDPDDHNLPTYDMTPGFKPFTISVMQTSAILITPRGNQNFLVCCWLYS